MNAGSRHRMPAGLSIIVILSWLVAMFAVACSPQMAPLPLTSEQRVEDFRFLSEVLLSSYPYMEVSKRITGYDWAAHISEFEAEVEAADTDREFAESIAKILRLLNNRHTGIVNGRLISAYRSIPLMMKPWKDQAKKTTQERADYWYSLAETFPRRTFPNTPLYAVYAAGQYVVAGVAPEVNLPPTALAGSTVVAIDGIPVDDFVYRMLGQVPLKYDPLRKVLFEPVLSDLSVPQPEATAEASDSSTLVVTLKNPDGELIDAEVPATVGAWDPSYSWPPRYVSGEHGASSPSGNLYAALLDGGTVYVQIRSMLSDSSDASGDRRTLREFMTDHQDIGTLVLDIRGNGGGSDGYWQSLVAMLVPAPVSATFGVAWRNSGFMLPFMRDKKADALPQAPQSELLEAQASGEGSFPPELLSQEFVAPRVWTRIVEPDKSLNYRGKVFLLVDSSVFSSAESFAAFCKGSRWATVVGSYTGGDGIGFDPAIVVLPNSGMVVRFPGDMGLNPDWAANEEFHTRPDLLVEWDSEDILQYVATEGRPVHPDPSWDPQLRICMEQATAK